MLIITFQFYREDILQQLSNVDMYVRAHPHVAICLHLENSQKVGARDIFHLQREELLYLLGCY